MKAIYILAHKPSTYAEGRTLIRAFETMREAEFMKECFDDIVRGLEIVEVPMLYASEDPPNQWGGQAITVKDGESVYFCPGTVGGDPDFREVDLKVPDHIPADQVMDVAMNPCTTPEEILAQRRNALPGTRAPRRPGMVEP